jgi:hypothetical protein
MCVHYKYSILGVTWNTSHVGLLHQMVCCCLNIATVKIVYKSLFLGNIRLPYRFHVNIGKCIAKTISSLFIRSMAIIPQVSNTINREINCLVKSLIRYVHPSTEELKKVSGYKSGVRRRRNDKKYTYITKLVISIVISLANRSTPTGLW